MRDIKMIEIDAPPAGWVYENRTPKPGEKYIATNDGGWSIEGFGCGNEKLDTHLAYAFLYHDKYADRYESLKLPNGWAWVNLDDAEKTEWSNCSRAPFGMCPKIYFSCRRIINGKAYRLGDEPI